MPGQWEPLFPAFADTDRAQGRSSGVAEPEGHRDGGAEWVRAPDSSHLWGFRFFDARQLKFLRTLFGGESHLEVRFKPSGKKATFSDYRYVFRDAAEGERVFEAMKAADHPGEVVHAELKLKGVTYYPVALD